MIFKCGCCGELNRIKLPQKSEHICEHGHCTCEENVDWDEEEKKDYSLKEYLNFNYQDYKTKILQVISMDEFVNLRADTAEEILAGLFSKSDIRKLRGIMYEGIEKDFTMRQFSNAIKVAIKPKDRYKTEDGRIVTNKEGEPILQVSSKYRNMMIARSEVVRLSNQGLLEHYKDMSVEKVSWVSSVSPGRTCSFCESQYGKIMTLEEAKGQIPAHSGCRCTWRSVVEEPK